MPKVIVTANKIVRPWPRIEKYQNSTLRFSPPPDFPEYLEKVNGRPKLMRCWITLDEVWDYRTDEYFFDYQIGVNRYKDDPNHYEYDWGSTVPADIHIKEHLLTHSLHADEVMLNVRRYERETADGIVSLDKYEEVVERVIEYYKDLCPNIRFIEVCNEVDYNFFGRIDSEHYYKLYKRVYRAVRRLNEKHNYQMPLGVGGTALCRVMDKPHLWRDFLQNLANDKDENLMLDFYSMHDYNENPHRMTSFYAMHKAWIKELGLPDVPIYVDEYGFTRTTGMWTDNLKNASGVLAAMLLCSKLPDMILMPWCTYHNPSYQMSFTQFLKLEDGSYASTPNGNAMRMLHMLKEYELEIEGEYKNDIVATGSEGVITLLATNSTEKPMAVDALLKELPYERATITQYLVDSLNNNRLTGPECTELRLTNRWNEWVKKEDQSVNIQTVLDKYGFSLWIVEPYRGM